LRLLFLSLLLLNVAFFAWHYLQLENDHVRQEKEVQMDDTVDRLVLANELENQQDSPSRLLHEKSRVPAPVIPQQTAPVVTFICYTVGPFKEMSIAEEAASLLRDADANTTIRKTDHRIHNGYWVRLSIENRLSRAQETVDELNTRRISDVAVIRLDDGRYTVSLGVFSEEPRARRRQAQFESMGYTPIIVDRFKVTAEFWIDVKADTSSPAADIWRELIIRYKGLRHLDTAC
jgi:hypothetical protein